MDSKFTGRFIRFWKRVQISGSAIRPASPNSWLNLSVEAGVWGLGTREPVAIPEEPINPRFFKIIVVVESGIVLTILLICS
jgi:hypothetical protein